MKKYLVLIRVKHWIKNFLIFIPMICARLISYENLLSIVLGFLSFSFACSFIYIINDIKDIQNDKLHEKKKNRPLASGMISIKTALIVAMILLVLSIGLNTYINQSFINISFGLLITYILINLSYSFGLKNIVILDIVLLAVGFILRVYYGAALLNIEVSDWLFLTILNASLFLGFGKRRMELIHNKNSRKVLKEYNELFLNRFQYLSLSLLLVFYSLWAIEQNEKYLVYTIPLVMIIFMKYSLIIENSNEGDPTTIIYEDKFLLGICILYGILMIILLTI